MAGFLFQRLNMRRPDSPSAAQGEGDGVSVACAQHAQPSGVSSRPQQSCVALVCVCGRNSKKYEEFPNKFSRATKTHWALCEMIISCFLLRISFCPEKSSVLKRSCVFSICHACCLAACVVWNGHLNVFDTQAGKEIISASSFSAVDTLNLNLLSCHTISASLFSFMHESSCETVAVLHCEKHGKEGKYYGRVAMVSKFFIFKPGKLLRANVLEQARHQMPGIIQYLHIWLLNNCVVIFLCFLPTFS